MLDISRKSRALELTLKITALLCGALLIIASIQSSSSPFSSPNLEQFLQVQLHYLVQLKWLIGVLFIAFGIIFVPQKISSSPIFSGEKNLNQDSYKLYLVNKYGIEKNSVLEQLTCREKLFPSVEEALIFAHQLECPDRYLDRAPSIVASQIPEKSQQDSSLFEPIDRISSQESLSKSLDSQVTTLPIQNHYRLILLLGISLFTVVLGGLYYANKHSTNEAVTLVSTPIAGANTDQVVSNSIPANSSPLAEAPAELASKPAITPINERWIGLWVAEGSKQKLSVTPSNFKYGNDDFTWVGVRPKGVIQCCPAFYEGFTSKADLLERIQKQTPAAAAKADQQKTLETVKALSDGNFKKIVLADPFLRKYFFIYDQNWVYRINRDLGDNADLVLEQFKKQE
jgi:hypothetical protein